MKWTALTPLEYFASLVHGDTMPLLETVASLAQDAEPQLDLQALVTEVDRLLHKLKQRLPADAGALTRLRMLHHYFYKELGFGGNRNDYYAARNSYLHEVLRTRMGIPVSLAVLWLELARGIQLRADGISFPGHFLLKVRLPDGYVVIDPMNGQSLSPDEIGDDYLLRHTVQHRNQSGLGDHDQRRGIGDDQLHGWFASSAANS